MEALWFWCGFLAGARLLAGGVSIAENLAPLRQQLAVYLAVRGAAEGCGRAIACSGSGCPGGGAAGDRARGCAA